MVATKYQIKQRETRDAKLIAEIKTGSPGGEKIKNPYEHGTEGFDNFNLASGRTKILPEKKQATKKTKAKKQRKTTGPSDWPGDKVLEPFPLDVCRKLVNLVHEKHTDKEKRSEIKAVRKDYRMTVRENQEEIDSVVKEEEADGRGKSSEGFSPEASKKIVGLQHDNDRIAKKIETCNCQISDLNDKIRTAQSDCDSTIAGQDPNGTLFEDAPSSSKDGE